MRKGGERGGKKNQAFVCVSVLVLAGLVAGMNFLRPVSAQNRKQLTLKVGRRLLFASFADTLDDEKENKNNSCVTYS